MRKTVKLTKKPAGNLQDPITYVLTLIPAEPPERAIRLRRQIMAVYSYCLLWVGTILGVELSAFAPTAPDDVLGAICHQPGVLSAHP